MTPYPIDLLKDLVEEAMEESSNGLSIGQDLYLSIDIYGYPQVRRNNIRLLIGQWSEALKLYRKMNDLSTRLYYAWLAPKDYVTDQVSYNIVAARSPDEVLAFMRRIHICRTPIYVQRVTEQLYVEPNTPIFVA